MRNAQVEKSEQLALLLYRMSRRNNKGVKRLNPEYD